MASGTFKNGNGSGVNPQPSPYGVWGDTDSGYGLVGTSALSNGNVLSTGVYGRSLLPARFVGGEPKPGGVGVHGENQLAGGTGVQGTGGDVGVSGSGDRIGVMGYTSQGMAAVTGTNEEHIGVHGESHGTANDSYGVLGDAKYGVVGRSTQTGNSSGVYGLSQQGFAGVEAHGNGSAYGLFAVTAGNADAVHAETSGSTSAVYGKTTGIGYAGFFEGRVRVTGTLEKAGGGFTIDHPLDPVHKLLCHSFVESPDMKNVYDGVAILDENGTAWIELPSWFEALNRDYRYQLTALGAPAPTLHIAKEISRNRFQIAGGMPGRRVSWQVTGIRQDSWANDHRIRVEEEKSGVERGSYLEAPLAGETEEEGLALARPSIKAD
jgi:hypothetical protein